MRQSLFYLGHFALVFLSFSFNAFEECKEHSEDYQINEDGVSSQVW